VFCVVACCFVVVFFVSSPCCRWRCPCPDICRLSINWSGWFIWRPEWQKSIKKIGFEFCNGFCCESCPTAGFGIRHACIVPLRVIDCGNYCTDLLVDEFASICNTFWPLQDYHASCVWRNWKPRYNHISKRWQPINWWVVGSSEQIAVQSFSLRGTECVD
jgi:hypothetical protein